MLKKRASGILLHITSLPAIDGIGDFGPEAFKFADFLVKSGQSFWQVLPLNHTTAEKHNSPYSCSSAFAGNPLLISLEHLVRDGLLKKEEIGEHPAFSQHHVEYAKVTTFKYHLFKIAFERFKHLSHLEAYKKFKDENHFWLDDFTSFISIQKHFGEKSWNEWPKELKERKHEALHEIRNQLHDEIEFQTFLQYIFYNQWHELKSHCNKAGIKIFGDIPIYVTYESPDVWAHPELFKLDKELKPEFVAGVPPDYFSKTGQLWRNPVYEWEASKKTEFRWWVHRFEHNLKLFDMVRIDHIRGLVAYWQIPAGHQTAEKGKWVIGLADDLFKTLLSHFPQAPLIAEDLGEITEDVRQFIDKLGIPTMKVLQFAFAGNHAKNPHIPFNYTSNCVVYTGTHDNNTTRGWYENDADKKEKKLINDYLGHEIAHEDINWQLIQLAMSSVARLSIIPAQDLLGLPQSARMNVPNLEKGNWLWRLVPGQLTHEISEKLLRLTETFARK